MFLMRRFSQLYPNHNFYDYIITGKCGNTYETKHEVTIPV